MSDDLTARLREIADALTTGRFTTLTNRQALRGAADRIEALEADLERARFHYTTERDVRNARLVARVAELEADLDDYRTIVREVAKVYDNLTSGTVSYPDTLASAVIAEHDERCYFRAERDAALADVVKLREAANRVNRAWLRGDIDGPDGEGPAALLALHRAADTEEAKSDG